MIYDLARPLLFALDAESAHNAALWSLKHFAGVLPAICIPHGKPVTVMGLEFANPIGLAAGLDKNAEAIDGLANLGFGFIEVGTVTPRAQEGNPKPRLFRLPSAGAIINRMGFNNQGVDNLIANVRSAKYRGVLGINIGKNFDTPIEQAAQDYLTCLAKVYPHASYITINISSPNTKNLRQLQSGSELDPLLSALKDKQKELSDQHSRYVPLALKIAPDLDDSQLNDISDALRRHQMDAVIACNTTLERKAVIGMVHAQEAGGLSGMPLLEKSTAIVAALAKRLAGEIPLIAVGGISSGTHVREKLAAGAQLVQLYTGLIYKGPKLIKECIEAAAQVQN